MENHLYYLQTLLAILSIFGGGILGRWFSKKKKIYWIVSYCISLSLIILLSLAVNIPSFEFIPPFSWLVTGRIEFFLIGFISAFSMNTLLIHLPNKRQRILVQLLVIIVAYFMGVEPFLRPLIDKKELLSLKTFILGDGKSTLQTTEYTCGPAAAVSGLLEFGVKSEEGQLSVWALTNRSSGTQVDLLHHALVKHYSKYNLKFTHRYFNNLDELKKAGIVLTTVKLTFLVDHFLTVIEVTDDKVIVRDPLSGLEKLTHAEFIKRWRYTGIQIEKNM